MPRPLTKDRPWGIRLSEGEFEAMETLRVQLGFESRAEVFRAALRGLWETTRSEREKK